MTNIEAGHIGQFHPDPNNARKHTPRNVDMIERSLSEAGVGRSIVATRDGTIIAGNATIDAAANAGIEEAIIVHTAGDRIIVHVRDDLDSADPLATKLALYDNRTAELAEWDMDVLRDLEARDVLPSMFTQGELDSLFQRSSREGDDEAHSPYLGVIEYRLVVDCKDEREQLDLMARLEEEGFTVKPLIT